MPDDDAARPVRLPGNAPDALKRFVACTTDSVDLDLGDLGWVPKPDLPGNLEDIVTPTATILDGWTPGSATIRVGYGEYISIELPATIVDGELQIDASNLGFGIGPEIDKWVDSFNRMMRKNGKQLDTLDVRDGKIHLTKKARAAATESSGAGTAPVTTAVPGTTPSEPAEEKKSGWGCFAWLAGAIAAIAVAIGLIANSGGDDNTENAVVSPTVAPATTAPAAATTTTSTTTTTIAEVGQAPPPVATDDPAIRVCGITFPAGSVQPSYYSGTYIEGPTDPCAPGPDSYTNVGCDPVLLPCSDGTNIVLVDPGGGVGIDHQRSVPDANTGSPGASTAEQAMWFRLFGFVPDDGVLQVTSDCGGSLLTGEAPAANDAITIVDQPLFSFGSCTIVDAGFRGTDPATGEPLNRPFPGLIGTEYTVGPDEPDPAQPSIFGSLVPGASDRFRVEVDWADSAQTIGGVLGAAPIDDANFWFFTPDNTEVLIKVLDASVGSIDRFWVFAAGTTDVEVTLGDPDTIVGHGGAFLNDQGAVGPSGLGTLDGAHPLDAIVPCGPGDVGFTVCSPGAAILDSLAFVTISGSTIDPIPIEPDGTDRSHTIDFGPSGGPSYRISLDEFDWKVTSSAGDTSARAIIRHNSLTLLTPQDELPPGSLSYAWSTTTPDGTVTQPVVPVAGVITTPAITADDSADTSDTGEPVDTGDTGDTGDAAAPAETVEEFYEQLTASLSTGDLAFALERLDPTVYEAYPTECPAALESFVDPDFVATPVAVGETASWTWELSDGRTFDVPDATTVTITVSGRGQSGTNADAHLTTIDGEFHWFTFCTSP